MWPFEVIGMFGFFDVLSLQVCTEINDSS
jgi:hypothetical protein